MPRKHLDLTGQVFGKVTISSTFQKHRSGTRWLGSCSCGNQTWGTYSDFVSGNKRSCGCLRLDRHPEGSAAQNKAYNNYERQAASRGLEFSLTIEDFVRITSKPCMFCGREKSNLCKNEYGRGDYAYNGIDRLHNNKGYIKGNCVPCCHACNRAKGDLSLSEFGQYLIRLVAHQNELNRALKGKSE